MGKVVGGTMYEPDVFGVNCVGSAQTDGGGGAVIVTTTLPKVKTG